MSTTLAQSPKVSRFRGPRRQVERLATTKRTVGQSASPIRLPSLSAGPTSRSRAAVTCANVACPSPDIVEDDGKQVCATCGVVARESNIVSEIQFGETSSGAAAVQGSYVGEGRTHGHSSGAPQPGGGHDGLSSREITAMTARREIDALIMNLGIPSNIADAAVRIFRLSLAHAIYDSDGNTSKDTKNFVQGRSIRTVAAVALYIACRRQKDTNTVMLIDIAEIMTPQLSVFTMGNMYNRMVRAIWGNADGSLSGSGFVDPINPENLIRRFARDLEFGTLVGRVTGDAIRLVQRMDRDWMTTGRRPAGICGAALILAARMNNFRRTIREVVLVVKVCEVTVNNRLREFEHTDSSKLTVDQMRQGNHTAPCDPPAFYKAKGEGVQVRRRGRKGKARAAETAAEIENGGEEDEDEEDEAEDEGEDEDEEADEPRRKTARIDKDGFAIPDIPIDPVLRNAPSEDSPTDDAIASTSKSTINRATSEIAQGQETAVEGSPSSQSDKAKKPGRPKGSKNKHAPDATSAEMALEAEIEHDIIASMNSEAMQRAAPTATPISSARATPASETPRNSTPLPSEPASSPLAKLGTGVDPSLKPPGPNSNSHIALKTAAADHVQADHSRYSVRMDPEILDDEFDDDPEVANVILSESEVVVKEHIWVEENKQWLRDQHAKKIKQQLQDAADIAAGHAPGHSTKKKRKRGRPLGDVGYLRQNGNGSPSTEVGPDEDEAVRARRGASVAMKGMLEQRGYSRRLNYDALSKMFPDDMASVREESVESRRSLRRKKDMAQSRESSAAASTSTATPSKAPSEPPTGASRSRPAAETAAETATSSVTRRQREVLPSPSRQPSAEPQTEQPVAVLEGEEELIHVAEESDSPLSSLPQTTAYNSPQLGIAPSGGFGEEAGGEDDDEDGDDEDLEEYEGADTVEQALRGGYRPAFGDDDDDDEDDEDNEY